MERDLARIGELDGIAQQIQQHLPQPRRIAHQVTGHARIDGAEQFEALFGGTGLYHLDHDLDVLGEGEAGLLQLKLGSLDLGQIEDVVDEVQQVVAGAAEDLDILVLLGRQRGLGQEVGDPHDGVHRRADFVTHARQEIGLGAIGAFGHGAGELEFHLDALAFGHVAGGSEHALQLAIAIEKGRGIVGHHRLLAIAGARRQLIVGDRFFAQYPLDASLGPFGVGEKVLERGADQFVAGTAGQRFHLLVDVGDEAGWVGGHQRVDVGFDQGARVKLLVAQALVGLLLFGLDQLSRGVVRTDQQVADNGVLRIAQRGHGDHRRKARAILADIGELVDVLDAARGLEHQGLEAGVDRGREFGAQRHGARDQFLGIGDVGRGDLVCHFGRRVAQHTLGADVEDLDDPLGVGRDGREIGAVENGVLQGAGLKQRLFRRAVFGPIPLGGDDHDVAASNPSTLFRSPSSEYGFWM